MVETMKAIVGAAQHVLERKLDEAARGEFPVGQAFVAALTLEAVRVWLRVRGQPELEQQPVIRIEAERVQMSPSAAVQHYGSEYGPN